jgi:hypothetical protein
MNLLKKQSNATKRNVLTKNQGKRKMEFSQIYRIRLTEEELKNIISNYVNEQKDYFVYSHDVEIQQKNGKFEALVKNAHKLKND